MSGKYDDILHIAYPRPSKFPRMSPLDRAAQFSPFAALTGYEETIQETGRRTATPITLHEDIRIDLDRKQNILLEAGHLRPELTVTYFLPDSRKAGGVYTTIRDRLKACDPLNRILLLENGVQIPLDSVIELDSPLFSDPCLLG